MSTGGDAFKRAAQEISFERNQGLDYEVRHILPKEWAVEFTNDGYVFVGPRDDEWETRVWRMVSFIAYKSFLALRRSGPADAVEYQLLSCTDEGVGFRAVFRGRPKQSSGDRSA